MNLGLNRRALCAPYRIMGAVAPRNKIFITAGSYKGTQIYYFFSLKSPYKRTPPPGSPAGPKWREILVYQNFLTEQTPVPISRRSKRTEKYISVSTNILVEDQGYVEPLNKQLSIGILVKVHIIPYIKLPQANTLLRNQQSHSQRKNSITFQNNCHIQSHPTACSSETDKRSLHNEIIFVSIQFYTGTERQDIINPF